MELLLPLRGQGMKTDPEQRLHLLRSHRIARLQTVDAGQPGTKVTIESTLRALKTLGERLERH